MIAVAMAAVGCGGPGDGLTSDTNLSFLIGSADREGVLDGEGNDSFAAPSLLKIKPGTNRGAWGRIDSVGDIDIYDLGAVEAGDRLVVEVESPDRLDPVVAIFDADENVISLNDDRDYFGGQIESYIALTFRHDTPHCYVAVAASPQTQTAGEYGLSVSLSAGDEPPEPKSQIVLLNFDGADAVEFGGRAPVDIPPFAAGDISAKLAGRTDELIQMVLDYVGDDFTGVDVEIRSSRGDAIAGQLVSTVHFGAYDPGLLGVAENVDEFNARPVQEAIVFTDTFAAFNGLDPTPAEYAQALANVASHEIGHLLGLMHTRDVRGVMDISASLRQLLRNQAFARSPLAAGSFPTGFQDAATQLVENVGGDADYVRTVSLAQLAIDDRAALRVRVVSDLPDPARVVFSTCSGRTPAASWVQTASRR